MLHRSTLLFSLFFSCTFSLFANGPEVENDQKKSSILLPLLWDFLAKNSKELEDPKSLLWSDWETKLLGDLRRIYVEREELKKGNQKIPEENTIVTEVLSELFGVIAISYVSNKDAQLPTWVKNTKNMTFGEMAEMLFKENIVGKWETSSEGETNFFKKVFTGIAIFQRGLLEKKENFKLRFDRQKIHDDRALIINSIGEWNIGKNEYADMDEIISLAFKSVFFTEEEFKGLSHKVLESIKVDSIDKSLKSIGTIQKKIVDLNNLNLIIQNKENHRQVLRTIDADMKNIIISGIDEKNAVIVYSLHAGLQKSFDLANEKIQQSNTFKEHHKKNAVRNLLLFINAILEQVAQYNADFYNVLDFLKFRFEANGSLIPSKINEKYFKDFDSNLKKKYDFLVMKKNLDDMRKFSVLIHKHIVASLENQAQGNEKDKDILLKAIEDEKNLMKVLNEEIFNVLENDLHHRYRDKCFIHKVASKYQKESSFAGPYYEKDVLRINASFKKGGNKEVIEELKAAIDDHPRRVITASLFAIEQIEKELVKLNLPELEDKEESYEKYLGSLALFINKVKIRAIDKPNATILHNLYTTLRTIYKQIKNENDQKKFFKVGTRIIQKIAKNNLRYFYPIVYLRSIFFRKNMQKMRKIKKSFNKLIQDTQLCPLVLNTQLMTTQRFYNLIQDRVNEIYPELCNVKDIAEQRDLEEVKNFMDKFKPEFVKIFRRVGTFEIIPKKRYWEPYNNPLLIKEKIIKPTISNSFKLDEIEQFSPVKKIKFCQIL